MPGWLRDDGLRPEEVNSVLGFLRGMAPAAQQPDSRPQRWAAGDASAGKRTFEAICAGCHGPQGKGGEGPALNNKVLLAAATDAYLAETISRGRRGTAMSGFLEPSPVRPALTRGDVESVVTYLRTFEGGKR